MNKTLKKTLLIAGITVAVCAAVWGGLTLARNAQRGDVNVYQVSDFAMTDYWGDTANTSGTVNFSAAASVNINVGQIQMGIYNGGVPSPNTRSSTGHLVLSNGTNVITASSFVMGSAPSSVVNTGGSGTGNNGISLTAAAGCH